MTTVGPRTHNYEVNAMLRVAETSAALIRAFFVEAYGVKPSRLASGLHLTIYHGRRPLPGINETSRPLRITANTAETRFMVLAPGGENPRDDLDPRSQSLGIRIMRRNPAITDIQSLRRAVYRLETDWVIRSRSRTTAWRNCFGSRHYQPHIQLLRPWHKISPPLTQVGARFRSEISEIHFDRFEIEFRHRVDGQWVVAEPAPRPGTLRRGQPYDPRFGDRVQGRHG